MALFDFLTQVFINAFGITQPSEATRRRATLFISVLTALMVVVVAVIGALFYRVLHP
ncbi:MAG: hypothetical protein ABI142_02750 [Bryocella sp.]